MANVTEWVERKILPFADKISKQRHLKAVQNAFLTNMAFMMIGSFALILVSPPIDYNQLSTSNIFYGLIKGWTKFSVFAGEPLNLIYTITLGCLSLYVVVGITYFLSKTYTMEPLIPIFLNLGSFIYLCSKLTKTGLDNQYFDGTGLFSGIIIGLLLTEFYHYLQRKNIGKISMPAGVPPALSESFNSLIPAAIILILVMFSGIFLEWFGLSFPTLIIAIVKPLIMFVDNVFGVAFASLLTQILWWFGIHDTAVGAVLMPIRDANFAANAAAYASGTSAYHLPYIYSGPYWWVFCAIGGSGATLSLAYMLLFSKSKQLKTVGKIAAIPAIFNINEPLIFGLPIMLNPILLFPFLIAQTLNAVITYLSMSSGIVAHPFAEPGWNMFAPIAAFLATFDYKAVILVIFLILLDAVIYYPFFKAYEKELLSAET